MKKLLNRDRLYRGLPIFFLVIVFFWTSYYWENVCVGGGCSYELMDSVLDPLYYASLSLLTFFTFFLFLPFRYFKQWLIWVFSWGIVVSYILVQSNIQGSGPLPIFAREVIIILSGFFWLITLLFCAFLWWWGREK